MKSRLPSFANCVLSVVCVGEDTGQLIANAAWETQGGRLFLVGTVPKKASQDDWMEGLSCAIAWDTVQDYVVFQSIDDYLTRLESGPRKSNKGKR
jgi:hypothetical protein